MVYGYKEKKSWKFVNAFADHVLHREWKQTIKILKK